MSHTLTRYAVRFVGLRLAATLFAITAFAFLFDFLDAGEDIFGRSETPIYDTLAYTALRLPSLVGEILLLATLLGGLFAAADLLRYREIVAIWNAGISSAGVAMRVLPLALALVAAKYVNDDVVVPYTAEQLRDWRVGTFKSVRPGSDDRWIWVHSGDAILRFDMRGARTRHLVDVAIFRRDAEGRLIERIDAVRARPVADGLELEQVVRQPVGAVRPERLDRLIFPARIDLDAIELMTRPAAELSRADLVRIVAANGYGMQAIHAHRTWLYHRLAGAIAPGFLLLLPFALLRSFRRVGGITPFFATGLALGFGYQILNGFVLALGEGGFLAPAFAAWAPTLGLALLTTGLLVRTEIGARALLALPRT